MDALGAMAGNEELLKKVASLEIENKSLKKGNKLDIYEFKLSQSKYNLSYVITLYYLIF